MIRKNQRFLNIINVLSDGFIVLVSYLLATWLWLGVYKRNPNNLAIISSFYQGVGLAACAYALAMLLLLALLGSYNSLRIRRIRKEFLIVLEANAIGVLLVGSFLYTLRLQDFSRGVLAVFFLLSTGLLCVKRLGLRYVLFWMRRNGYNQKRVLVVGSGRLARQYVTNIKTYRNLGFTAAGYFGKPDTNPDVPYLGGYTEIETYLKDTEADAMVLALEPDEIDWIKPLIGVCERCGTKVSVIPFYNDVIPTCSSFEVIGDTKLISLRSKALDNMGYAFLKRAFDIVFSVVLLILLSPLLLIAITGTKLSSPGPVFFKQERVGRNKKRFMLYKIRSMRVNAAEATGWTTQKDPRKTRFGSFLRKFSIDELPQLYNVLKGDMSLIGPRPEIPYYVERFAKDIPLYMVKHQVRPGMTGWAQVNGYRGDTSIAKRIEYDIWYIENWSVGLELAILIRTFFGAWYNHEKLSK